MITYVDTKPDKIVVYGLGVPEGSAWTYRVNRELAQNQCLISGWACDTSIRTRVEETEVQLNNFKSNFSLINRLDLVGDDISNLTNKTYGEITNIDSNGRWSLTLPKTATNIYKAVGALLSVDVTNGFSASTIEKFNFNSSNFPSAIGKLLATWSSTNVTSNMKVIAPAYTYTSLDQPLYVTGDWSKVKDSYYDEKYIDTRIIKFIPIGNQTAPKQINLFAHGWDKEGPLGVNFDENYRENIEIESSKNYIKWINIMDYNKDTSKYSKSMITEISETNVAPEDLNIAISWKDASVDLSKKGSTPIPDQPFEAAKWIDSVAEKVADHIYIYLNKNPQIGNIPINCTGHSLGSLLCRQISIKLSEKQMISDTLIALDPPSEFEGKYNLDGRRKDNPLEINTTDFFSTSRYLKSIAFVGSGSFCGNENLAKSANVNISLIFNNLNGGIGDVINTCTIHGRVVATYLNMLKDRKVVLDDISGKPELPKLNLSNFLSATKRTTIAGKSEVDLVGIVEGIWNDEVQYFIRSTRDDKLVVYGTNKSDNINLFEKVIIANIIYPNSEPDKLTLVQGLIPNIIGRETTDTVEYKYIMGISY